MKYMSELTVKRRPHCHILAASFVLLFIAFKKVLDYVSISQRFPKLVIFLNVLLASDPSVF